MSEPLPAPRKRVLVIDDDADFVELLKTALSKAPIDIHVSRSGEEGLEYARYVRPHLIVLDVMMPGIHGIHALNRLRSREETAHTPILIATTLPREEIEVDAAAGDAEVLDKSVPVQTVATRITRRLGLPDQ